LSYFQSPIGFGKASIDDNKLRSIFMSTFKRFLTLLMIAFIAAVAVSAQSGNSRNTNDEKSVEESYLQEAIELMIIRETSHSGSLDQKMLALQYIGEAIERGNTSADICQALEFLSMEGVMNQARENGRMVNNYPLVRREAAKYLGQLGTPEAEAALIDICKYDREPMVLQEAIKALGDCTGENSDRALDAIIGIVGRFDVLNPDNMMALAAIDAIAKIANTSGGLKVPGAVALLIRIADGPYIRPVQNKARQTIGDLRKYGTQQNQNR
jgi:hypothetical protein